MAQEVIFFIFRFGQVVSYSHPLFCEVEKFNSWAALLSLGWWQWFRCSRLWYRNIFSCAQLSISLSFHLFFLKDALSNFCDIAPSHFWPSASLNHISFSNLWVFCHALGELLSVSYRFQPLKQRCNLHWRFIVPLTSHLEIEYRFLELFLLFDAHLQVVWEWFQHLFEVSFADRDW